MGMKLGRYKALIAVMLLFLGGTGTLLTLNYVFAQRTAQSVAAVRTIGQQSLLPRVIASQTQIVKSDLAARRYLGRALNELKTTVGAFDTALESLEREATAAAGQSGFGGYAPLASPASQRQVQVLRQSWGEYRSLLKPVVAFNGNPYVETADRGTQLSATGLRLNRELDDAVRFGLTRHEEMANLIGALTGAVASDTRTRADQLRRYLVIGFGTAALLLASLFYFGRKLSGQEQASLRARKETDDILRTVNQGLFLVDRDLRIGAERSEALEHIFRRKDFNGLSFDGLLRGIVPEKTLQTAVEYVQLLWGERVNEKLVKTINPLIEVEVHLESGSGSLDTQYLEFDFNRVRADGAMTRLLVTVNDVTRRVHLARELQESQEKAQAQLDLLLHILHVEPRQLSGFLEESEVAMKMVNSILKEPAREETAFRAKLDGIFRQIHGVKGEAAALGLKTVESRAHGFEEFLSELRGRPALSGNDFLPLVVKLDDLFGHLAQVREMVSRLADLRLAMSGDAQAPAHHERTNVGDTGPEGTLVQRAPMFTRDADVARSIENSEARGLEDSLRSLASRIAGEQSKRVELHCSGLDAVPQDYRRAVKDIAIQMVRNCVAHGIETPEERAGASKGSSGAIVVKFESRGGDGFELICQDDGRGLSAELLKATAVKRGLLGKEQAEQLDDRRALSLIFMPGFSTQSEVTKDAGRGVGMDLVRNLVQELGGKVGVSTTVGKFARFRIWLPATSKARAA